MIKKHRGIRLERDEIFVLDGKPAEGVNFVSHAHSDHAVKSDREVICSSATKKLLEQRFDLELDSRDHENIELMPSGHIVGSSSALIDGEVLYTGDVSLQDRAYMDGFNPVSAEKLIVESTYGIPAYTLPDQQQVVREVKDWVEDTNRPILLFGYSLGKAQKIQQIVQKATEREIIAHGAVQNMNKVIENITELKFRSEPYTENREVLEQNGLMVLPSHLSNSDLAEKLVKKHDALKAGFSGWAVQEAFRHRGGYDKTFPLSDHCGFKDLVKLVEEVDPEKVYTHHGFDEAFASYLKDRGYNARALKKNQSSLSDF